MRRGLTIALIGLVALIVAGALLAPAEVRSGAGAQQDAVGADAGGSIASAAGAGWSGYGSDPPTATDRSPTGDTRIAPTARRSRTHEPTAPAPHPLRTAGGILTGPSGEAQPDAAGTAATPSPDPGEEARLGTDARHLPRFNEPRNVPGGSRSAWPPAGAG